MNAVPFHFDELYGGLAKCHGLVRLDGKDLCLEFQIEDGLVGALKSSVKQVHIPTRELSAVRLDRYWFGLVTKLVIQGNRMEAFQDVPGMKQGRLTLGIARRDRPTAERLVAELALG